MSGNINHYNFLDDIEKDITSIFIENNFDFEESYTKFYNYIFNNLNIIKTDDLIVYTTKVLEKIVLLYYKRIDRTSCNLIDNYNNIYNEIILNTEKCNKMYLYLIENNKLQLDYYTNKGKYFFYKYVYCQLNKNLNKNLIELIENFYDDNSNLRNKYIIDNYFRILHDFDRYTDKSIYLLEFKGTLFKKFFNNYLNDFFINSLNKIYNKIINYELAEFTFNIGDIYINHTKFLKLFGLELYHYEYYYIFHSFLLTKDKEIRLKLEELYNILVNIYNDKNRINRLFDNNNITTKDIKNICTFFSVYIENFSDIINTKIMDFVNKILNKNTKYEDLIYISYNYAYLYCNTKKEYPNFYKTNIISFNLKFNNILKTIENWNLDVISKLDNKYISACTHNFIKTIIYKNKLPLRNYTDLLSNYIKFNKESKIDEIMIYYRKYLINRLIENQLKNKENIKELVDIEYRLICNIIDKCKTKPNIYFSKIKRIIEDMYISFEITNEYNSIYQSNPEMKIIVATDGIWGFKEGLYKPVCVNFDNELQKMKNNFNVYYTKQKYENKKLEWNDKVSRCDIVLNFQDNKKIEFLNCTYQQCDILFLYNERNFIDKSKVSKTQAHFLEMLYDNKILIFMNNRYVLNIFSSINKISFNIEKMFNKYRKLVDINKTSLDIVKVKSVIAFTQEDYIRLFVIRELKKMKKIDKLTLLYTIQKKYEYDKNLIKKVLVKLVEDDYIGLSDTEYLYI